jgi:iron complex outermembrane receptor protein
VALWADQAMPQSPEAPSSTPSTAPTTTPPTTTAPSTTAPGAAPAVALPQVNVAPKRAPTKKQAPKQVVRRAAPLPPAPQPSAPPPRVERANGPVDGIVATRSATGTKTDTPIMETPNSVSVISAKRIEQQGATTVSEALAYTAGVSSDTYGADSRFDWLRIRGFDAYLPGYFVDGMLARNNNTWSVWKVETYGAERIEVLKGPASVLYGQVNVGGIVNVVSKRPLEERLNEVGIRIGNHNRVEGVFDFSGPLTKDGTVLYRLTGVGLKTDNQVDYAEEKRLYIAPAVTWRPNIDTSITVLAQYLRSRDVADNRFLPVEGTLWPNAPFGKISRHLFTGEPGYDKFHVDQWAVAYLFEHRVNDIWQVRQSMRYREMKVDYKTVYGTGLLSKEAAEVAGLTYGRFLSRGVFTTDETAKAFTTDNQLQADFATGPVKHTVLAGLDYQHNIFGQRATIGGSVAPLDMYNPVYGASVTEGNPFTDHTTTLSQAGLYLQEQAKIADRWIVILGGRYDWAKNHTLNRPVPDGNGDMTPTTIANKKDEAFTWKAGLLYQAPIGVSPYITYSQSFFPSTAISWVTNEPFDPETGQQYEAGIKFQPFGPKSLFTLAAFDIKRQNYVTNIPGTFEPRAIGEIHSRGFEFEAAMDLASGLTIIAAYTWLPVFEITKSAAPLEVGKREPTVPEHMASLWAHYRFGHGPLTGFGIGGGVRYVGETFGNIANEAAWIVPDYTLFDGVIDYERYGWRFALNVRNIGDRLTIKCWDTCYYGKGRSIILSALHRW